MGDKVCLIAHTKVNLGLDIVGRRPNGYHDLLTIFQKVSLHDKLLIERDGDGIEVTCSDATVPVGRDNLCHKAASKFFDKFAITGGLRIHIEKHIPVAGGVGGGSADAAAVLKGCAQLFAVPSGGSALSELAASIGADVPFLASDCVRACGEGIGEKLTPLAAPKSWSLVIVNPAIDYFPGEKKTPFLFSLYDAALAAGKHQEEKMDMLRLQEALQTDNTALLNKVALNAFEPVACGHYPVIAEIKEELKKEGAFFSLLAGAGPCVFGAFTEHSAAEKAGTKLARYGRVMVVDTLTDELR